MKNKKVLITGCCGFIGFHLSKYLIKKNFLVFGIDNMNNYYDPSIKYNRLTLLKYNNNFNFKKLDLKSKDTLRRYLYNNKFDYIIHLAAQAGVRYSFKNPQTYIDNNILAFHNILELNIKYPPKHFIYASSSSVYANIKSFPFKESMNTDNQINLYGATKKCNEILASAYAYANKIPFTGLRFFTVYGPHGRPDMALYKFLKAIAKNKAINLFNNGNHYRDFTYVEDIVESIFKLLSKKPTKKNDYHQIFNIGSSKPVFLKDIIGYFTERYNKIKINYLPIQKGDIYKTYASVQKLNKRIKKNKFISFKVGLDKFIEWYESKR